jgi:hypothetical protein
LDKLGRQYAGQDLVIVAVNTGESKARYREFIESRHYDYLQWTRDSTREISKLYQVRGIPVTYLLDAEGIIRYAHVGYGEGMDRAFAQEIELLLE